MKKISFLLLLAMFVLPSCTQQIRKEISDGMNKGFAQSRARSQRIAPASAAAYATPQPHYAPVYVPQYQPITPPNNNRGNTRPRSYDIYDSTGTRQLGTLKPTNSGIMPIGGWNR